MSTPRRDLVTDEILHEVETMYRLVPVHVSAREVAERLGAPTQSVSYWLRRAAEAGLVEVVMSQPERRVRPASNGEPNK